MDGTHPSLHEALFAAMDRLDAGETITHQDMCDTLGIDATADRHPLLAAFSRFRHMGAINVVEDQWFLDRRPDAPYWKWVCPLCSYSCAWDGTPELASIRV